MLAQLEKLLNLTMTDGLADKGADFPIWNVSQLTAFGCVEEVARSGSSGITSCSEKQTSSIKGGDIGRISGEI